MKKKLLSLMFIPLCLMACGQQNKSNTSNTSFSSTSINSLSSSLSSSTYSSNSEMNTSSSSSGATSYEWTEEQIKLFNDHLDGYILPTIPTRITHTSYYANQIVIDAEYLSGAALLYSITLKEAGFAVNFDEKYDCYTATKNVENNKYIYL